jgi:hypothetical protein
LRWPSNSTVAVEGANGRTLTVPAEAWLRDLQLGRTVGMAGLVRGMNFANDASNRNYAFIVSLRDVRLVR